MDSTRDDKKVKLPRWYVVHCIHCILGKCVFVYHSIALIAQCRIVLLVDYTTCVRFNFYE